MATVAQSSTEEPISGVQGKGTIDEPFDQGNAVNSTPALQTSSQEPPSGVQGKGTANEPFDKGNAPETVPQNTSTTGTPSQPTTSVAAESTPPTSTNSATTAPAVNNASTGESRGRESLKAPAKSRNEERSISPGTMPDGTHATTSGDRGESYEPGKLSKLKGKFFGKH